MSDRGHLLKRVLSLVAVAFLFSGCYTIIPFQGVAQPEKLPSMDESQLIEEYQRVHWWFNHNAGFRNAGGKWNYIGQIVDDLYKYHKEWKPEEREKLIKDENYFTRRIHSAWGDQALDAIDRKQIWIGMTKEQLHLSWGNPNYTNRTTLPNGLQEQCIYGSDSLLGRKYVYLDNGIVTSWQDSA